MEREGGSIRASASAAAVVGLAALCLAGVGAGQATQAPAALKRQFDAALEAGDTGAALRLAPQVVEAAGAEHVEALYATARLHAARGHREQAYLLLARAVGAGFYDRGRLLEDAAFAGYRDDELFRQLARKAWANGYIRLLERPNREDVQKSPEILKALAFRPGERVADIGAGSGYFTFQVAEAVGPTGHVLALDAAPEMLEFLTMRAKARKTANVTPRQVGRDDPQLPPRSVDTILIIDTIHYVKDRTAYAKTLLPALAPGGRVVIIDYLPKPMSERPWGPPPEQQFPREQLDREMRAAGFEPAASYAFLPEQFFVVYVPSALGNTGRREPV